MTNIEQIYRRFVEEHRRKLVRFIDDKMRWTSFRAFWRAVDPTTRHQMSREKSTVLLKIMVKHFFIEKEVTSTLVMDALYTGLKALEHHSKGKKGKVKSVDLGELSTLMVHVDVDMFVLAGDLIALLERAASEPLSSQPFSPKDDNKCSQNRAKDGGPGEISKVSIEREERRLTEIGQKILETFVLSHIFSGIEIAYQEAVALKRQEELIREEELLENEMKGKRGNATEKDKRAKKKQAKQKKNKSKVKDKEKEEKSDPNFPEMGDGSTDHDRVDSKMAGLLAAQVDNTEEGASDASDNLDGSIELCQTEMHMSDKTTRPVNPVVDVAIETHNAQTSDSDSTMEIETLISSVSATVSSIRGKINNLLDSTSYISPRGKGRRNRVISRMLMVRDEDDLPSSSSGSPHYTSGRDQDTALLTLKDRLRKLGQRLHEKEIEGRELLKAHLEKKAAAEAAAGSSSASSSDSLGKTPQAPKAQKQSSATVSDAKINATPPKAGLVAKSDDGNGANPATTTSTVTKPVPITTPTPSKLEPVSGKEPVSISSQQIDRSTPMTLRSPLDKGILAPPKSPVPHVNAVAEATPAPPKSSISQPDKVAESIPAPPKLPAPQLDNVAMHNSVSRQIASTSISKSQEDTVSDMVVATSSSQSLMPTSRPSSAPVFQAPRSAVSPTPTVKVSPSLSQSMTVSGQSSNGPSLSAPSYATRTYRNAILGKGNLDATSGSLEQSTSAGQNGKVLEPLSEYASATSVMVPPVVRNDQLLGKQGFMSGASKPDALDNWHPWKGNSDASRLMWRDTRDQQMTNYARVHPLEDNYCQQESSSETKELGRFGGLQYRQFQKAIPASFVSHQQQGQVGEEFPHIGIINDLLDEEQTSENMAVSPVHEYHAFGLPFPSRGGIADPEMASVSSSGRFNLTGNHYDESYQGAYDTLNALHRLRAEQLSTLDTLNALNRLRDAQISAPDVYSNGRLGSSASKPWLYSHQNPAVNLGINPNVFSQQMGNYTNLTSERVNGEYPEYLYRRAQ